jgi:hypothetical protein
MAQYLKKGEVIRPFFLNKERNEHFLVTIVLCYVF